MAFRYLIYSTGTTYAETIVRESPTDNPGVNEASLFTDFVIPEIQPLYLWRVTGGTDVVPNLDSNISAYLEATAPPPQPEDDASVGFVTGLTDTKIDTVTGATADNVATFTNDGNVQDSGFAISALTADTKYNFTGSGGTTVTTGSTSGVVEIIITSTTPTGTTVAWGDITGTLSNQTDLVNALNLKLDITDFNSYTGTTATELAGKLETSVFTGYTATTQPVIDSALTGVTNLGTGTTLGGTSGRNVTVKSISVLGGLSISGDANNLILSGGSTGGGTWGSITGTLSDQTDLWNVLTGQSAATETKLDIAVFTGYTATTETRLEGIEADITGLTATTANKLDTSVFNAYTGTTQPIIDSALTGATNGLTAVGRDVELGGTLTKDTTISGLTNNLTINTGGIVLQSAAVAGIDIIDAGAGGIVLESDGGQIDLIGNDSGSTEVNKISISETLMQITDGRGTPVGLEYVADYSTTFNPESLITKRYADTIAGGLIPKAAVLVATTGDTILSGLTTIDGVTLQAGDRVLVKDQTSGATNGIYSASTGTWGRTADFDGNPSGEVSAGNIIPVLSGDTQYSTLWVLVTPNPITVGTTDLEFTLFSSPHELIPGIGINITGNVIDVDGASLAGNSISWTGNTFNVDINSGTLSIALDSKLDVSEFNSYTGTTDTRLDGIESDIVYISGVTDSNFDVFTGYTATTETRLEGIEVDITGLSATTAQKLDTAVFTGYTATTAPNEIFLIHTGGTDVNTILATAIEWDAVGVTGATGSAFSWTGSSEIEILEGGDYEINYNIPYNIASNSSIGVGANLILNNSTVLDVTAAAGLATRTDGAASIGLPTVIVSLEANDVLNLATFRTHQSGSATSALTGSILIKKKNTLQ